MEFDSSLSCKWCKCFLPFSSCNLTSVYFMYLCMIFLMIVILLWFLFLYGCIIMTVVFAQSEKCKDWGKVQWLVKATDHLLVNHVILNFNSNLHKKSLHKPSLGMSFSYVNHVIRQIQLLTISYVIHAPIVWRKENI